MNGLSAGWIEASKIETWLVLASLGGFLAYYMLSADWWRGPGRFIGWGIVLRESAFIAILGMIVAQELWPPSASVAADFVRANAVLLGVCAVGINLGTGALAWHRHKRKHGGLPRS